MQQSDQAVEVVIRHLRAMLEELEDLSMSGKGIDVSQRFATPEDPGRWELIEERPAGAENYRWPDSTDTYGRFAIYETADSDGRTYRFAVGDVEPEHEHWGRRRIYRIVHQLVGDQKVPWAVFMEPDDFERTRELIALIRGAGATKKGMYSPSDALPADYDRFATDVFRARVPQKGAFNRLVVVAGEADEQTMLDFALVQARLRGGL
jgi:hypothetical protein